MSRVLDVCFQGNNAGRLVEDDSGRLSFVYADAYLAGKTPWPLSVSMPVRVEPYEDRIARAFFSGLLPDERVRHRLARLLGVSEKNPFSLLEAVGGECAGALSLYPEGTEPPPSEDSEAAEILDEVRLRDILALLRRRPLLAGQDDIRLSLAGAQDKLAVRVVEDRLALMHGGAPTTHILKSVIQGEADIRDSVHNELFCLLLAARVGIPAPHAEMRMAGDEPFLLVERYDRVRKGKQVVRLHQEDFCQALSVPPESKYEREGGPGVAACLKLIQKFSIKPVPDRMIFLKTLIFNYLIGNADAHGKNFSFLYEQGKPRLAPAYDLLSTAVYSSISSKMAMKIGGRYRAEEVFHRHWHRLVPDTVTARKALDSDLKRMAETTQEQARKLIEDLHRQAVESEIFAAILAVIEARSKHLLKEYGRAKE